MSLAGVVAASGAANAGDGDTGLRAAVAAATRPSRVLVSVEASCASHVGGRLPLFPAVATPAAVPGGGGAAAVAAIAAGPRTCGGNGPPGPAVCDRVRVCAGEE